MLNSPSWLNIFVHCLLQISISQAQIWVFKDLVQMLALIGILIVIDYAILIIARVGFAFLMGILFEIKEVFLGDIPACTLQNNKETMVAYRNAREYRKFMFKR